MMNTEIPSGTDSGMPFFRSFTMYQSMINALPDGIVITDTNGIIKMASEKVLAMYGYNELQEVIGQRIFDFISPDDQQKAINLTNLLLQRIHTGPTEYTGIMRSGKSLPVQVNADVIRDDQAQALAIILVIRDVSSLKKIERELNLAQKIARMGSWEMDLRLQKMNWSDNYYRIIGRIPGEIKPCHNEFKTILFPEDLPLWETNYNLVMESNQKVDFKCRLVMPDQSIRWIRNEVVPIINNGVLETINGVIIDITNEVNDQETARKQFQNLQAIIKAMPDLIFVLDREGYYCEVYAEKEENLLVSLKEIIGKNLADIFPSEQARYHLKKIEECLNTQKLVVYEYELYAKEVCEHWEARLIPLEQNTVLGLVRDFTEIRKAQKLLRELNATLEQKVDDRTKELDLEKRNFETFFNSFKDMLFVLDTDTRIIHANSTALSKLQYAADELIGQPFKKIHYDFFGEGKSCKMLDILKGESELCELPIIGKNKEFYLVEKSISKGIWNNQEVIFLAAKDISALALSEEKFYKVFQSNGSLIVISTFHEGIILDVNDTFYKALGYTKDEVIGLTGKELNLYSEDFNHHEIADLVDSKGSIRDREVVLNRKDMSKMIGLVSVDGVYIGKVRCLMTSIVDITERKHSEDLLMQMKLEAENANRAKSEFLSRMSHELRTPLNSILGFAQLLEMRNQDEKQKIAISHILDSGKHLLDLINEVLDISRIEAGRVEMKPEVINLSSVISELIDSIRPSVQNAKLQIVYPRISEAGLYIDPKFFRQIMLNLLSNAIKYNKEYGIINVSIENDVRDNPVDSVVRIKVRDSGIGIAEDKLPLLFNPFERIGADQTNIEGTGLGLAVVKKLVENMGGRIFVESRLGQGSCFTVEFPVCPNEFRNSK